MAMIEQHIDGATSESKFDADMQELLDRAAGYEHHEGHMDFPEGKPGEVWSIKVENC